MVHRPAPALTPAPATGSLNEDAPTTAATAGRNPEAGAAIIAGADGHGHSLAVHLLCGQLEPGGDIG